MAGRNVKWSSHSGEEYGSFLKKKKTKHANNISLSNCSPGHLLWRNEAYIQKLIHECLSQFYS